MHFPHDPGAPTLFFPEIMGSGVALLDYDQDGRLDILFRGAAPGKPHPNARPGRTSRLFHQLPDGRFEDSTVKAGLDDDGYAMGVAVGDVNNDGFPDVYLTNFGSARLYINQRDGTFLDVTATAGVENLGWGSSATFVDFDRDGRLDLFVCNYCDYSKRFECGLENGRRDYCHPLSFKGSQHRLFRNVTAATAARNDPKAVRFAEVTEPAGLGGRLARGLGVHAIDFDDDGWPDLYVANDGEGNYLWINRRDGTFEESGVILGCAVDANGQPQGSMGVAEGDVDGDGRSDLVVTNFRKEYTTLYLNRGFGFVEASARYGLPPLTRPFTGFGVALMDVDCDGRLELLQVNGRVTQLETSRGVPPPHDKEINVAATADFWKQYAEPNLLLSLDEQGRFRDSSHESGAFCLGAAVSRGMAVGDLNGDGAPDLVIVSTAGLGRVFLNTAPRGGQWLVVKAIDPALGGRDAYGAKVVAVAGDKRFQRTVQPGSSYQSSDDPSVHFGLGDVMQIDHFEVRWPHGSLDVERFPGGASNRRYVLKRGEGGR